MIVPPGTLTTARPEIPRDRWGKPLVTPPNGGKPVAYYRCTNYIDVIEDKYALQQWMQRQVALGLHTRPDLILSVAAHRDDKQQLNRICDDAREAAGAHIAATTGTALHSLTELVDAGVDLPILPAATLADLDAYRDATAELKAIHIEQFTVLDTLKIGGTPDRIVEYRGERYIADLKTGSIEYGALKIAAQLAVYARSSLYDHATGERTFHGASTNRGIVIHLPAGSGTATLHWIDLETGWEAVKVAQQVREQRAIKFKDLTEPFGPPAQPSLRLQRLEQRRTVVRDAANEEALARRIAACGTADQVRALWAAHEAAWTPSLTEAAKTHIASLPEPPAVA